MVSGQAKTPGNEVESCCKAIPLPLTSRSPSSRPSFSLFRLSFSLFNLSYFDEPTQPAVSMTESLTESLTQYVIEGTGSPQLVTNFELHRHPAGDPLFDAELTWETNSFWRYRRLSDLVSAHGRPFTTDDLKGLHIGASFPEIFQFKSADATDGGPRGTGSTAGSDVRTLWHCLFDQQSRTVAYRFYLGDEMTEDGRLEALRSDYLTFTLEDEPPGLS